MKWITATLTMIFLLTGSSGLALADKEKGAEKRMEHPATHDDMELKEKRQKQEHDAHRKDMEKRGDKAERKQEGDKPGKGEKSGKAWWKFW